MGYGVLSIEKGKNGTKYVEWIVITISKPIFSVDAATTQGFVISQTLPDVKGYFLANQNPILECLVDQMDHDEQRSGGKLTGLALRDEIIHALTQNTIEWPQQANKIVAKEEWITLMKKDPLFYKLQSRTAQEMTFYEAILLDLASKYLKRRITLIPFLEGDQEQSFPRKTLQARRKRGAVQPPQRNSEASKASSYHLLSCNKAADKNFYISIFRK